MTFSARFFAVGRGEAILSPEVATRIVDFFGATYPAAPREAFPSLTEREREILYLLAKGHPDAEIATRLSVTVKSVSNYVSNILSKLQVADELPRSNGPATWGLA